MLLFDLLEEFMGFKDIIVGLLHAFTRTPLFLTITLTLRSVYGDYDQHNGLPYGLDK